MGMSSRFCMQFVDLDGTPGILCLGFMTIRSSDSPISNFLQFLETGLHDSREGLDL